MAALDTTNRERTGRVGFLQAAADVELRDLEHAAKAADGLSDVEVDLDLAAIGLGDREAQRLNLLPYRRYEFLVGLPLQSEGFGFRLLALHHRVDPFHLTGGHHSPKGAAEAIP